jgi:hypothetical protein
MKWLNVVMDLSGILCVCIEERLMPRGQTYVAGTKPHSGTVLHCVRPKAVYIRPSSRGSLESLAMWQISLSRAL